MENNQSIGEKKQEVTAPQQPPYKTKLLQLSQMARRLAYWIDEDTTLPQNFYQDMDLILNKMNAITKFIMDSTEPISESLDEEVKAVPNNPNLWYRIKSAAKEKNGGKELGKVHMWHANKEYKDKGGKFRKKKVKKNDL